MKLLSARQINRLTGRDRIILQTGISMAKVAIMQLGFWKRFKFLILKKF